MSQQIIVPELSMLTACLERAILDATGNTCGPDKDGKERCAAIRWIFIWRRSDYYPEFSFPWVCQHLDLCPYTVKKLIKKFIRNKITPGKTKVDLGRFIFSLHSTTATESEVYYK